MNALKKDENLSSLTALIFMLAMALFTTSSILVDSFTPFRAVFYVGLAPIALYCLYKNQLAVQIKTDKAFLALLLVPTLLFLSVFWSNQGEGAISTTRYFRWYLGLVLFLVTVYVYAKLDLHKHPLHFYLLQTGLLISILSALILHDTVGGRLVGPALLRHAILGGSVLVSIWMLSVIGPVPRCTLARLLVLVTAALLLYYILLTKSRGPLLAMPVILAVAFYVLQNKRWQITVLILSVIFIGGLYYSGVLHDSLKYIIERGGSYRLDIWRIYLAHINEYWLIGLGYATDLRQTAIAEQLLAETSKYHHPHNLLLTLFVTAGAVTPAIIIVLSINIILKMTKKHSMAWSAIAMLLCVIAVTITDTYTLLSAPQEVWFFFWMPMAYLCGLASKKTLISN